MIDGLRRSARRIVCASSSSGGWPLACLVGVFTALALAGEVLPWHPLEAVKLAGAGVAGLGLVYWLARLPDRPRIPTAILAWIGFAVLGAASLAWSMDRAATAPRAQHLLMEAALLCSLAVLPRRPTLAGLSAGGAVAAAVIGAGFLVGLATADPGTQRIVVFGEHANLQARDAAGGVLLLLLAPRVGAAVSVVVALVAGVGVGLSFSFGAAAAVVAAAAGVLAVARCRRPDDTSGRRSDPAALRLVGALLLGVLVGGAALSASPSLRSPRAAIREPMLKNVGSGRPTIWHHGLAMARDHAPLGVGLAAFPAVYEEYRLAYVEAGGMDTRPRRDAHSTFLGALAELGPVGLALLLAGFALASRGATRDAALAALLAFSVASALTDSLDGHRGFWLLLAAAALRSHWPPQEHPVRARLGWLRG